MGPVISFPPLRRPLLSPILHRWPRLVHLDSLSFVTVCFASIFGTHFEVRAWSQDRHFWILYGCSATYNRLALWSSCQLHRRVTRVFCPEQQEHQREPASRHRSSLCDDTYRHFADAAHPPPLPPHPVTHHNLAYPCWFLESSWHLQGWCQRCWNSSLIHHQNRTNYILSLLQPYLFLTRAYFQCYPAVFWVEIDDRGWRGHLLFSNHFQKVTSNPLQSMHCLQS